MHDRETYVGEDDSLVRMFNAVITGWKADI